ncbi:MAG: Asp23/Gls24 family envelope stress response protein [Oscillospiraceae bacterium]|nr:Asp23/Gls24 family envelope stress response protein [Oscillospiraceae bacterium]
MKKGLNENMIVLNNHLGSVSISRNFFTALIGSAVTGCYGVAGTNAGGLWQNMVESLPFLKKIKNDNKGVNIRFTDGKIFIDLHITVVYGVNVASIVKSIQHKVTYITEEQTGIKVGRVNVYVDAIKS